MIGGLFDKTINLLGSTLDLRAERQKLLASNIANQETPGYRAVDIKFEDELRKSQGGAPGAVLIRTSPLHMPVAQAGSAQPRVLDRASEIEGYDKNSVGIESEMVRVSENTLMYTMASKMLRRKFGTLMTAIREGGR